MPGRLGVDFGTSNTVIALWDEVRQEGLPCHIPDYGYLYGQGKERISVIPSLINYPANGKQWVGNQVIQQNLQENNSTFRWMKRYISNRSPVKRRLHGQQISHFDAGKDFLTRVLLLAAQINNINNEEVAFTVPVEAFEDYENWLAEVAKDAGMPRFRLIDEPSAAALGYGAQIQPGDVYLIFDFGGGTLDVAVVLIDKQTHLGLSIFEMSTRHENSPNTGVELVFDPSGAARLNNLTPSEEEERNYFWLNEKNPTFLTAKPEPKKGEKCFQV